MGPLCPVRYNTAESPAQIIFIEEVAVPPCIGVTKETGLHAICIPELVCVSMQILKVSFAVEPYEPFILY
ncbi:MAG: hypothetical protein BWY67_02554 [Bacteroidetes bacterium ADurb.Bin397]|nr:MAG: hypothetical protein BWY67_02554 [Bacteroidetes bacterium ADurb.Bin397]